MKKKIILVLNTIFITSLILLTGCGNAVTKKSISYTFAVDTGDKIIVTLDASDGYSMSGNDRFEIKKDGEILSQGVFIFLDGYELYADGVRDASKTKLLEEGTKGDNEYVMWNYDDSEYNYVMKIYGSNTALVIGNDVSEESARECFERLDIKVKE